MILQNNCFAISESLGDILSFLVVEDCATYTLTSLEFDHPESPGSQMRTKLCVNCMAFVKSQRILSNHLEWFAKARPGLPISAMGVTCCDNIRSSFVDLGVNRECGRIDRLITFNNHTVLIDKDQRRHCDLGEMLRKRVQPWSSQPLSANCA